MIELWDRIGEYEVKEDYFHLAMEEEERDRRELMLKLSERIEDEIRDGVDVIHNYELHERVLRELASIDFESYLLYMEWNRERKFYSPRMRQLRPIVRELQRLENNEIDLLAISLPPGTGKTTLALFYLTWIAGRHPDSPSVSASHSHSIVEGMYEECLRFMGSDEYRWGEVFGEEVVNTKAKELRIDVRKKKRFQTLSFTSIGAGNAGKLRAAELLYCDDLVDGIETAMSYERLEKLWQVYTADLRQRKIGNCKELHIATRWSLHDVIGRLRQRYEDDSRSVFLDFPAMDENDESNFDYECADGFSTAFYREQRDIMDEYSWRALYMNEPIEREGRLYDPEEIQTYYELPSEEPDTILACCDTKSTGEDYCVLVVGYKYGDLYYIEDVVCDNGKVEIVDARLVECLLKNNVAAARFEANAGGYKTAENIQNEVNKNGGRTSISRKYTQSNKETRIIVNSAWVKKHCVFKENPTSKDYKKFMEFMYTYTMGKHSKHYHDDVPDALAMFNDYVNSMENNRVTVLHRFF